MDKDPIKTEITEETYGEVMILHVVDNSEDIRNEQIRTIILQVGENIKLKKRGWKKINKRIKRPPSVLLSRIPELVEVEGMKSSKSRVMLDRRVVMLMMMSPERKESREKLIEYGQN